MYREEVIAKALREHREKLNAELLKNRSRQKELNEHLTEHQLAIRTLSTLVKGKSSPTERTTPGQVPLPTAAPPVGVTTAPAAARPAEVAVWAPERKGYTRDKLKAVAFPHIQSRFANEPFEVSKVRDLLDELEPEVSHTYEAAWNLCNDMLREGKLKQAGIRKLPKGIVRLFVLKSSAAGNRPAAKANTVLAEG
jgi:hypothetical protein